MVNEWRVATARQTEPDDTDAHLDHGAFAPTRLQALLISLARKTVLKRGRARALMANAIYSLRPGPIDVSFRGAKLRLLNDNNIIKCGILLNPAYNGRDTEFLLEGAPEKATFVDIGANIGLYSLPLAAARPQGRVLAIDANPAMTAQLIWNAQASKLAGVETVTAGVSDTGGRADLRLYRNDLAIASITETENGKIPVKTLADLINEAGINEIYGLKIDIEGHEDKALAPFLNLAPASLLPKRIVIETASDTADYPACSDAFSRLGYELEGRTRNNSLYRLTGN